MHVDVRPRSRVHDAAVRNACPVHRLLIGAGGGHEFVASYVRLLRGVSWLQRWYRAWNAAPAHHIESPAGVACGLCGETLPNAGIVCRSTPIMDGVD